MEKTEDESLGGEVILGKKRTINSSKTRGKNKSEISRIEERELREFLFVSLAKYWTKSPSMSQFTLGKFFLWFPWKEVLDQSCWGRRPRSWWTYIHKGRKIPPISATGSVGWTQCLCTFDCGCFVAKLGGCLVGCHLGNAVGKPLHLQSPTLLRIQPGSCGRICWPVQGCPPLGPRDGVSFHAWPPPSHYPRRGSQNPPNCNAVPDFPVDEMALYFVCVSGLMS